MGQARRRHPQGDGRIADLAGGALPGPYTEFLRTYGFAEFFPGDTADTFDHRMAEGGGTAVRSASIRFVSTLPSLENYAANVYRDDPDNGFPLFPRGYFPVARDAGQSLILLEIAPNPGRVWFHPDDRYDPWGEGDNTALGHVADSFYAFINGLRMAEDRP